MKRRVLISSLVIIAMCPGTFVAEQPAVQLSKTYTLPMDQVYAAVVQVASAVYNLKSATKEGYVVSFFSGGQFTYLFDVICRETDAKGTLVTLSLQPGSNNPQIFGKDKARTKEAQRFWMHLDSAIQTNRSVAGIAPNTETPLAAAQISVRSTPDGADIYLDDKFAGSTPSTLHVSPGDHAVKIVAQGYISWERSLSVTAGNTITLNAALSPLAH